jgi:hypothetical protein
VEGHDSRCSLYSFDNYIDKHERQESLDKRDEVRYSSAIYDTANRKITMSTYPYGVKMSQPPPAHATSKKSRNFHESLMELQVCTESVRSRLMDE